MVKPLVEKHSERKWGAMVIIKSLQLLPTVLTAALRETAHDLHAEMSNGSTHLVGRGNMLHIALVGINNQMSLLQDSGDEDQAQERINKLAKILREKDVSSSLKSAGVEEKLKVYDNIKYTPSRDRQWHLYTVLDKRRPIQRMFLRTLVRQSTSDDSLLACQGLHQGTTPSPWLFLYFKKHFEILSICTGRA
ncbi:Acetyl-CoA Carboxylase [Datura stramonium]|uniref:Acetyl-CoA Carboxylase n=1 Tax=Datura stramonium TaxID=4076 RepID=A0ABS8WKA9_DATST|nr:Acetyl-CoA Carboxylase [Datura stramonium]